MKHFFDRVNQTRFMFFFSGVAQEKIVYCCGIFVSDWDMYERSKFSVGLEADDALIFVIDDPK